MTITSPSLSGVLSTIIMFMAGRKNNDRDMYKPVMYHMIFFMEYLNLLGQLNFFFVLQILFFQNWIGEGNKINKNKILISTFCIINCVPPTWLT